MNHRLKTYDYTPEGRLSRRTWARGATYAYDHRGRMVRKGISRGVGGLLAVVRSQPTTTNSSLVTRSSSLYLPTYDANGNQTLIQTETGIWSVIYNGENRPVLWSNGITNMVMAYDRMGRRVVKNSQRFSYDGYLQIADNNGNAYAWDPTEPVATRPLVWSHGGKKSYYFHDGNKNVTDVMAEDSNHYNYAPFGASVDVDSSRSNPWYFSSEYCDGEISMSYYIYRHYSFLYGRWCQIDPVLTKQAHHFPIRKLPAFNPNIFAYSFCKCDPISNTDILGLAKDGDLIENVICCQPADGGRLYKVRTLYNKTPCCRHKTDVEMPENHCDCITCAMETDTSLPLKIGRIFGSGARDGPGDALRHCVWSCLMARRCGNTCTAFATSSHESFNPFPSDNRMDFHNNAQGISTARKNGDCVSNCMDFLYEGNLLIINPIPLPDRDDIEKRLKQQGLL